MRVIVHRRVDYRRPGKNVAFCVLPSTRPKLLPRDVAAYIVDQGAGTRVEYSATRDERITSEKGARHGARTN